jgi:hypothetical protein
MMIVAIAGRKSAGKTTLANVLLQQGFVKISFATKLKELLSHLYGWDKGDLSDPQIKEKRLSQTANWDEGTCHRLSSLVNESIKFDKPMIFETMRQAMQHIGTDVLRKHDPDFHVKATISALREDTDYVCDDVRFPNEIAAFRKCNALCIYILRPSVLEYSNHASEISVTRHDCDYVFLNNVSIETLTNKFRQFIQSMSNKHNDSTITAGELKTLLERTGYSAKRAAKELGCSPDKIVWWSTRYGLPLLSLKYKYDHDVFATPTIESSYWAGVLSADGCVKRSGRSKKCYAVELSSCDYELTDGLQKFVKSDKPIRSFLQPNGRRQFSFTINSPYITEDMKLWNIEPRKSARNKIPDCVKQEPDLFNSWLVGLIDGDGSVFRINNGDSFVISCIASGDVIDYVNATFRLPSSVQKVKNTENLSEIRYTGKFAVELWRQIYRGQGLRRKWSIVDEFVNKQWRH